MESRENATRNEFSGARVRIFGTNPDDPEKGRIFVWTKMGWFERTEGPMGGVAFIPIAKSRDELRQFISRDNPSFDLVPLGREYRKRVSDEFTKQSPSSRDVEDASEEANEDSENNEQQYHQHGL